MKLSSILNIAFEHFSQAVTVLLKKKEIQQNWFKEKHDFKDYNGICIVSKNSRKLQSSLQRM